MIAPPLLLDEQVLATFFCRALIIPVPELRRHPSAWLSSCQSKHWAPVDVEQGEFAGARKFYDFVSSTCDGTKRERVVLASGASGTGGGEADSPTVLTTLAQDEACWAVRAEFGAAQMELRE